MTLTALIVGLAKCGQGNKALEYFYEMQIRGVKPDAITFVGVLVACSHAGLVDERISHFNLMSEKYGIRPSIEHYGCLVYILGRAGRIAKAEELIKNMPMALDHFVLGGLLGACRIHDNLEAAERAAQQLLELLPDNGGSYVILSNRYSSSRKWKKVKRIRELMAERNIKKPPGCILIEVGGVVHEFVKEVLFDMDEEEKETALNLHTEKLAITFGLVSPMPGVLIRIVKNLRVCNDCHTATNIISKVYNRETVVMDRNRFHHFKNGSCSCKDFW
ncbi:hypothetical protein AB3S75_016747 [Citrus x aurantiifolia]